MKKHSSIIAVIPARRGSKRLKNKNIRHLCGKPLIMYTIQAALKSKYLNKIILSTDSPRIAQIGKQAGLMVPGLRPKKLAEDHISAIEPTLHAVRKYSGSDWVLLLQPTSPLRTSSHIDRLIRAAWRHNRKSAVSVCPVTKPAPDSTLHRQLKVLPKGFRLNGALYFAKIGLLREQKTFLGPKTLYWKMCSKHSVDIDTKKEFMEAEKFLSHV